MSAEVLVTSFSVDGASAYGRRSVESWRYWPESVRRIAYVDEPMRLAVETRITSDIAGWHGTQSRLWRTNPTADHPMNYIWDARRFAVKAFVWLHAAEQMGEGLLTWLDGDTLTTAQVPDTFTSDLLGGFDVAYLGRGAMHPETGYVSFRIPEALPLLRACVDAYTSGAYRSQTDGWTDCHVLRACLRDVRGIRAKDLTSHLHSGPWNSKVDAFALSPLGPYVTHFKGSARKREAATT